MNEDKRIEDIEGNMIKLMVAVDTLTDALTTLTAPKPSLLQTLWTWCQSYRQLMIGVFIGIALLIAVKYLPTVQRDNTTIPATELLMSEKEARLTFSAMDIIEKEIDRQAIKDTATATEALRAELPTTVQEPVVKDVQSHSDGTIEQYPTAMEKTKRRILIRR